MNEFLQLLFSLLGGAVLGAFFFAGLWWTVRKLTSSKHVTALFLGSLLVRTAVVISGFYFIMDDNWQRLLVCLLGFIIARIIVTRLTRIANQPENSITAGSHES